jgi:large subunit ribosomal protein L21
MKFAVIETGGKQYIVSDNKSIIVEKLAGENGLPVQVGDKVVFDKVILTDDGSQTVLGSPYIAGEKVEAEISEQGRGKKVLVVKYKPKSRYYKKRGHKQPYSKATIKKV